MAYIVTTSRPPQPPTRTSQTVHGARSRRAVATLQEARDKVVEEVDASFGYSVEFSSNPEYHRGLYDAAMPDEDGTVGPLPDGTVIEVAHASWDDLVGADGWGASTTEAEVITAYNAKQAA